MTPPVRSVFDLIYDSAWHHPLACWVAAPPILWTLLRARPRPDAATDATALWRLMLLAQVLIVLDALCTGAFTPFADGSTAATVLAVAFVVLGDLRYFVLLERFAPAKTAHPGLGWLGRALAISAVITMASWLSTILLPNLLHEPRHKFLAYELMFLALLLVLRGLVLPGRLAALRGRDCDPELGAWILKLTAFEAGQYALWVLADVLILSGVPAGLLLRLCPNLLYYVAFVPFAYFAAPQSLRQPGRVG